MHTFLKPGDNRRSAKKIEKHLKAIAKIAAHDIGEESPSLLVQLWDYVNDDYLHTAVSGACEHDSDTMVRFLPLLPAINPTWSSELYYLKQQICQYQAIIAKAQNKTDILEAENTRLNKAVDYWKKIAGVG